MRQGAVDKVGKVQSIRGYADIKSQKGKTKMGRHRKTPAPAPLDANEGAKEKPNNAAAIKAAALEQREREKAALRAKAEERKAEERRRAEYAEAARLAAIQRAEQAKRDAATKRHALELSRAKATFRAAIAKRDLLMDSFPLYKQASELLAEISERCNAGKLYECWGRAAGDFEKWSADLKNGYEFICATYLDSEREAEGAQAEVRRLEAEGVK